MYASVIVFISQSDSHAHPSEPVRHANDVSPLSLSSSGTCSLIANFIRRFPFLIDVSERSSGRGRKTTGAVSLSGPLAMLDSSCNNNALDRDGAPKQ